MVIRRRVPLCRSLVPIMFIEVWGAGLRWDDDAGLYIYVYIYYLVVLQQPPVLGQEHQSSRSQEFLHVHELDQSPVDHNLTQRQNRGPQHHDGSW